MKLFRACDTMEMVCCFQIQLDEIGCELNCSTMTDHTQEHKFVIARNEVSKQATVILGNIENGTVVYSD